MSEARSPTTGEAAGSPEFPRRADASTAEPQDAPATGNRAAEQSAETGRSSTPQHPDSSAGSTSSFDRSLRETLRALAPNLRHHRLAPGDRIFSTGSKVVAISIIERGLIALRNPNGATLMLLPGGGVVGDVEAMTESRAEKEAKALIDTEIVRVPGDEFRWLLQRSPEFALCWSDVTASRMAGYERRLLDLLAGDIRAQVASLLLHEFADADVTQLTHQTIAEMLGVQRTSVSRVLSHLVQHGVIYSGYAHMRLRDRNALARTALGSGHPAASSGT